MGPLAVWLRLVVYIMDRIDLRTPYFKVHRCYCELAWIRFPLKSKQKTS